MLCLVKCRGVFKRCGYEHIWILRSFASESATARSLGYSDSGNHLSSENSVAVFWDLDNKPPKSIPLFDAAIRLKKVAENLGFVKHMVAYGNGHAFSYSSPSARVEGEFGNRRKTWDFIKPKEPYVCGVCGRRFYTAEKLNNHFKIHECEHTKRLNQIESSRGMRRVNLVGKYFMKMEKYRNAAKQMSIPKDGYSLADELKQAGFSFTQAGGARQRIVDMIDRRVINCLVLVSHDSGYEGMLKEWRDCLRTVVVGDTNDGALKRIADASFSWQEIMMGKARKEALSVVGKWKDQDVLKRLEWNYDPKTEKKFYRHEMESEDFEGIGLNRESDGPWWKLQPENDVKRP